MGARVVISCSTAEESPFPGHVLWPPVDYSSVARCFPRGDIQSLAVAGNRMAQNYVLLTMVSHLARCSNLEYAVVVMIPVQIRPEKRKYLLKGQTQLLATGLFHAQGYVDGKWVKIGPSRKTRQMCMGDIHKWAGDRSMWFDRDRMEVKGTVLK